MKAEISEIFSSIQGEGLYLGQKQIFVRFSSCNLNCDYCDEPKAKDNKAFSLLSVQEVVEKIKALQKKEKVEAVSLTGGEPLLQADFIEKILPKIKELGLKAHLETNAVLFKEFKKIAKNVDVIAADIK
ncbi:MAG: 7-carboxy-7-deazaguanine synthase QueE, partial [Elusimicrobiota bacterium]|nr:7-carboxy-7-deazaguanine synthase QueE [Elusimicrobiota bacterium]